MGLVRYWLKRPLSNLQKKGIKQLPFAVILKLLQGVAPNGVPSYNSTILWQDHNMTPGDEASIKALVPVLEGLNKQMILDLNEN